MSQEHRDDLAVYLGLQGFVVESVSVVLDPRRWDPQRRIKLIKVVRRSGLHHCPDCGRGHQRGLFDEMETIRFRDSSIGDFETYIETRAVRIACCGGTRVERLPFAMPGFRMARRFFERIAALCTRMPVYVVMKMANLAWDTVARVDKCAIELALPDLSHRLRGLRWMGVDEVSRTGGHDYFTIVTNLETGCVVWIGDGKGSKGLAPFFEALGPKGRRRIRGVVSDLGYRQPLVTKVPAATWILDRFHIVKWLNEGLNALRRRLFSGAPKDDLGRSLKVQKWLLLSARERLEHKHKLTLTKLLARNEPLYKAYVLKELLRGVLLHPWKYLGALRRRLEGWLGEASASGLPEIAQVAERLQPHVEAVVAGHAHHVKLGLVEATNGKIAALRVQGRGYRKREYHKAKIYQRCSLPDNPWAQIIL
jgi:transposase